MVGRVDPPVLTHFDNTNFINQSYVLSHTFSIFHLQIFKLLYESLKPDLFNMVVLFVHLLQDLLCFSWRCNFCYLLKIRLVHNFEQYVQPQFVFHLRLFQRSNLGHRLLFILRRLLVPTLHYITYVLGSKKSLYVQTLIIIIDLLWQL